MNTTEFDKVDEELRKAADAILIGRRAAYAGNGDVLKNFKEVAAATGLTVAKVWEVYFRKALNALRAVVEGGEGGGEERIERAVDALNYVRLGWAIAQEKYAEDGHEPIRTRYILPAVPIEKPEVEGLKEMMKRIQDEQNKQPCWVT